MATMFLGRVLNNICSKYIYAKECDNSIGLFIPVRHYAARKGTRAKRDALKAKRKLSVRKAAPELTYEEKRILAKRKKLPPFIIPDDSKLPVAKDNIFIEKYFKWKIYNFEDAVNCHRETHDPTIFNSVNAEISASIELNLQGAKKTKLVHSFSRIVLLPNSFDYDEKECRKIIVFSNDPKTVEEIKKMDDVLVGGKELIKSVQAGDVLLKQYEYCIAHPDIMPDLLLVKGLLKRIFPTLRAGTLSTNLITTTTKFNSGIRYTANPHELKDDYGLIMVPVGTLNMDTKHIEENFAAIIQDVNNNRPKREGPFITRTRLVSPLSNEKFIIDFTQYLPSSIQKEGNDEDEEEDDSKAVIESV